MPAKQKPMRTQSDIKAPYVMESPYLQKQRYVNGAPTGNLMTEEPSIVVSATIDVEPLPKSRPRFGKGGAYTDAKVRRYEEEIGWRLKPHVSKRNDSDDLKVHLAFRTKTRQRKDIDNLIKSIFDACNKVVWNDDQQVTELHVTLSRGSDKPGFDIRVEQVAESHQLDTKD
jgi:Holliday junction resolvase RusA-like endonuclease